jgi:hypothetical protein
MLMGSSRRKMLAARDDLADKVSDIAASKGFTLFHMLNNMLELTIKANELGTTLDEAVDTFVTMRSIKEASFTLILESLLYETAEVAYGKSKEKTLKIWYDAGSWVAQQYITKGIQDPFKVLARDLGTFGWNIPEFTVEKNQKTVFLRVLSPRFSDVYTLLFTQFLEGILVAFGYQISNREVGKGNIRLEATMNDGNVKD